MSAGDPRREAASIVHALRRWAERESGTAGGELAVSVAARARRTGAFSTIVAPRASASPGAAPSGYAADTPEPASHDAFALTPPEPMTAPPPAAAPAPPAPDPLPPFALDLNPGAQNGGRDAIVARSRAALDRIAAEARACVACQLARTRTQAVPGTGSAASGIVFVGEAPGADEDAQGEPFVGRAGELLTKMIAGMDERALIPGVPLDRSTVYILNVLKCRPPENRNPLPPEIEACSPFVIRQLEALEPRMICCLGKFAAELLCGIKGTVGGMRGKTYRWRGAKLVVTYHPAYLLRNPRPDGPKREVWNDLQRLAREYLTD